MSKPTENTNDFDFDNMQILQDIELDDATAFQRGKIEANDSNPEDEEEPDDPKNDTDDEDDNQDDDQPKPQVSRKKQPPKREPLRSVSLSDELLVQGLQRASGKEPKAVDKPGEDDQDDDSTEDTDPKKGGKGKVTKDDLPEPKNAFEAHYRMMVNAGVWEEIEGFDGSRAKYDEAVQHNNQLNLDNSLDDYLVEAFENNPEGKALGVKLIKHLAAGGKVSTFQQLHVPAELDFDALDDEKEDVAEAAGEDILRSYYREQGWEKEDITSKINGLKKTGGLIDEAKLIKKPYTKLIAQREEQHQNWLETTAAKNKSAAQQLNNGIMSLISKGHAFGGLKVAATKKEQLEIQNYIFQPNDKGVTGFRDELMENLRDPEFLLFTAIAMRKKLHKDPNLLVDPKSKSDAKAKDELEEQLSKALLNKKLDDKGSRTGAEESAGGSSRSKMKFNLDEAIVLEG